MPTNVKGLELALRPAQGWVLLTGRVPRTLLDGSAHLVIEHRAGQSSVEVPVSRAGFVYELVYLPAGVERMVWQPSMRAAAAQPSPLRLEPVSAPRRFWLMARRVAYMLWTRPVEQKLRVGLAWRRALGDLPGQYRASGRLRAYRHGLSYAQWLALYDHLSEAERARIRKRIARLRGAPRFALVVHDGPGADATRESIDAQLYPHHSPDVADADYVMQLDAGDRLAPHALYWLAEAIVAHGDVALAYCDDDAIAADGARSAPRFKPDWSPEHLRAIDYIGRACAVRKTSSSSSINASQVVHVPAPLYHRAQANGFAQPRPRVRYPVPQPGPLVSIIVPTRDRLDLLRRCVESVQSRTSYARREIIVVDNRSAEPETRRYLESGALRVLRYDAEFNFAAINNFAARQASGEVLVLLNNDTEVISPDWLEEMLGHLLQDGVGAVGAKLYYPDGTVQHAGDAVGIGGGAQHLHNGLARGAPGYCYRAVVAQEVSAVTAACLMTRKDLYLRLGGMDERRFPVSFNDVDYCLRLQEAGYRVIFTPHAELYHHESASRGDGAASPREAAAARALRRRWRARLERDPYYNPNLSNERADFSLADPPRMARPWLK